FTSLIAGQPSRNWKPVVMPGGATLLQHGRPPHRNGSYRRCRRRPGSNTGRRPAFSPACADLAGIGGWIDSGGSGPPAPAHCRENSPPLPGAARALMTSWRGRSSPGPAAVAWIERGAMKLTLHTFLTVDGVMQSPGGAEEDASGGFAYGGWLVPFADQDMGAIVDGWFEKADAILVGRTTYDAMFPYWSQV